MDQDRLIIALPQEVLEGLVLQGIENGEPREMTQGDWDELRRRVEARALKKD